jgi:hypothetical protein
MKKKISTTERAETTEFFCKSKKQELFCGYRLFSAFLSSRDENQRMREEKAESAEIILRKASGVFDLPGSVGKGAAFPPASRP